MHGVVEGFYGKPYSPPMRRGIIRRLSVLPDPVYLYAPKDDPFHRMAWRQTYPQNAREELAKVMAFAVEQGVEFFFGLSPWKFMDDEAFRVREKLDAAVSDGAAGVCLLFDDIPETSDSGLAERHLAFAEEALRGLDVPVLMCPSVYCRAFLEDNPGAERYLEAWRKGFNPDWDVLWTGPDVVSRSLSGLDEASLLLGKDPVIWDNLLADDYCVRRVFFGSLEGRVVSGTPLLLNPSCIFPVALHGVMELVGALGGGWEWPAELGPRVSGWNLMRDFHFTPWETGPGGAPALEALRNSIDGDAASALIWLNRALAEADELADRVTRVIGGWDLYPLIRDMTRVLSIWRRALSEKEPSSRRNRLHYLMHCRLPHENPLAASAAHPLEDWFESSSGRF